MSFYPIQVEYKDKSKKIKEAPLVYDVEKLKADLMTTMPSIFTFGVSQEKMEGFYKRLQSRSEVSFHDVTERAKEHITQVEAVTLPKFTTQPDHEETRSHRRIMSTNFLTAVPFDDEEEDPIKATKREIASFIGKVLKPKVLPPLDIEKTIREAQGMAHLNKDIEELQKGLQKAKKGMRKYGADIVKTKEQIDNLDFHAKDNFGVGASNEARARAEFLFDAMGEDEQVKDLLRPPTKELYKKKRHASVQVRSSSVADLKGKVTIVKKPVWGSPRHRNNGKKDIPRHLMNMPRARLSELQEPIRGFVGANEMKGFKKGSFLVSMFT